VTQQKQAGLPGEDTAWRAGGADPASNSSDGTPARSGRRRLVASVLVGLLVTVAVLAAGTVYASE
jgi:hypothetical protein